MTQTCPLSDTVGGYLLGVLCAQETAEFRRHAALCPNCEREITYLAPVARFLKAFKAAVREDNVREDFDSITVQLGYKRLWEFAVPVQRKPDLDCP